MIALDTLPLGAPFRRVTRGWRQFPSNKTGFPSWKQGRESRMTCSNEVHAGTKVVAPDGDQESQVEYRKIDFGRFESILPRPSGAVFRWNAEPAELLTGDRLRANYYACRKFVCAPPALPLGFCLLTFLRFTSNQKLISPFTPGGGIGRKGRGVACG